jgi:predicted transcriptional regulator
MAYVTSSELRNGFKRYSKRDINYIEKQYGNVPISTIAYELNRTKSAIYQQVMKMGLTKTKTPFKRGTHKVVHRKIEDNTNADIIAAIQVLIANGAKISIAV